MGWDPCLENPHNPWGSAKKKKKKKKVGRKFNKEKRTYSVHFLKNLYSTLKETEIKIRILVTKPEN